MSLLQDLGVEGSESVGREKSDLGESVFRSIIGVDVTLGIN